VICGVKEKKYFAFFEMAMKRGPGYISEINITFYACCTLHEESRQH